MARRLRQGATGTHHLNRAEPLETLSKDPTTAVAEFVRLFAHELNNPLATIRMSAEMLQTGTLPPEMQNEIVDVVFNETIRMEALIEQAVYYTAIPPANPLPVEIGQLLETVRDAETNSIAEEASPIAVEVANVTGLEQIGADGLQLARLLREVLANALQSGASRVELSARCDNDDIIFQVSDDGEGISAAAAKKIFQPFYTTREGRLGLGLATAKRIAEQHGGAIEVTDAAPAGTIVSIRIPNSAR